MLSTIRRTLQLNQSVIKNSVQYRSNSFSTSSSISNTTTESSTTPPPPANSLSKGELELKDKLELNLKGCQVEVQDVSGGCGTFYAISIQHASFKGLSMIKQHRIVNDLLKEEIKGMHGLQLKTTAE